MKKALKKLLPQTLLKHLQKYYSFYQMQKIFKFDKNRFLESSFSSDDKKNSHSFEQLQARITKEYHSLEKGLSYKNLRLGFGKQVLKNLINLMTIYKEKGYNIEEHSYQTALSNLQEYIDIHTKNGYNLPELTKEVKLLGEGKLKTGGVHYTNKSKVYSDSKGDFKSFSLSRHSVRDYSNESVEISTIEKALELAKKTPSACNRQSWKVRIVEDPKMKKMIQNNQNGNRGFGDYIDKFIIITADTQYYAKPRERNQANIDGGMYAMNLLYALHYYNIAAVPLSASLVLPQEYNLREAFNVARSENFIMFIGLGNYIDEDFKVPKSDRRSFKYELF